VRGKEKLVEFSKLSGIKVVSVWDGVLQKKGKRGFLFPFLVYCDIKF